MLYCAFVAALLCACDSAPPTDESPEAAELALRAENFELPSEALSPPRYFHSPVEGECCLVIAHAGGAIDGNSYTNSKEAILANYALGRRYFELDFLKTRDGHWVAVHDWPQWQKLTAYAGETPPDLATFLGRDLIIENKGHLIGNHYSSVSLAWVIEFLSRYPDALIVSDIKDMDLFNEFVELVLTLEEREQFIFQAYTVSHVDWINRRDPSARIILTLYRMGRRPGLAKRISDRRDKLVGVTLPMGWAYGTGFMDQLKGTGVPLYLHGHPSNINSQGLHGYFSRRGVSGFYLD